MQIFLRGTCTRAPCEHWHPPECQFYKHETGCKAGDKCLFPHYKVDEQPNRKPKKSNIPKGRENDDNNAVAIVKSVSQLCCVSQDAVAKLRAFRTSEQREVSVKPDAESLERNSKGTIHKVSATSSEYQGKERTIVGKNKIQIPHQRSPNAMKFEDRSP